MKKITLWLFALFTCWQISAQTGTVVVGVNDGTPNTSSGVPSPLQDYYKTQRMQILYTAAELSGAGLVAGNITEIGWVATALNASTLQENYTISMKSTASTVLTGTFETGATVVYGPADFTPSTTGNVMFTLSTPFTWDGTSNVIIELCAGLASGAWSENVSCANSTTAGIQTVYNVSDSATAPCTQATGTTTTQRPLLVATGNVASCLAPLNIVFNNVTSSTADISWDPVSPVPGIGYEYVVSTSNVTPAGAGTATIPVFASLTGLNPQTTYYIFVRSNCSTGVFSGWNGPVSFTTNCTSVTSFVENFDAVTTPAFPNCWAKVGAGGTTNTQTGSANSAPNTMYFASFSTTSLAVVSTQQVSNLGAGTNRIKFDMRANFTVGGVVEFGYLTDPADATTFVPLTTFTASALTYSTYQFSPPAGSYSDYPAFRHTGNPGNSVLIDNVVWEANPACADQTGVVFSNLTTTSADTSWDPIIGVAGYEYAVNTSATPPVSGTSTTATIYAATGLTPETLYYIHVRPMCSPGVYGAWASISFYTGYCLPSSTSADSYVNNFSTTGGSQNISNLATGFTAGGYLNANSQFVESYETSSFNFNAEIVGGTAGFSIWIDWNNDLVLDNATEKVYNTTSYANGPFTGTITIPAGTAIGNYRMRITTDWNASNPSNPCAAATRAEFEDYTISVIAPPACLPSSASVSSFTDVTANLNWTAVPTALVGYEYVLDNVAANPAGSGTATTAITYSASGLTPSTVYYFHVRSVCGVGSFSAWSTISFTTSCASVNVPYTENFETATVPNLPMCTSQQNVGTGNLWTVAANLGYGFTTNALIYSYNSSNAANVWFYTNGINLTGGTNYKITYDYGAASATFPEKLKVAYGTSALASAMTTVLADHTNVVNTTPLNSVVNFTPTVSGVYYFGFNANSIANQFYLLVDNVSVDVVLSNDSFNNKSNVMAYPNPVKDVLNLSYKTAISNVRVINLLGQEVLNTKTNTNDVQVDMSALNAGAYIVNITVEDTVHTIKVIKE